MPTFCADVALWWWGEEANTQNLIDARNNTIPYDLSFALFVMFIVQFPTQPLSAKDFLKLI
jgi:hypothetical protein